MEITKYKKYLKEEMYVQCTVCANYRNINSFAHRKSEDHQKKLTIKLRKISYNLSQVKRKSLVFIHDEHWPEKDSKRFCHFCGDTYLEHMVEDSFAIEFLGTLYHHSSKNHSEAVKTFLKRNFRKEAFEKYCVENDCLERFLMKIPPAKEKYIKKMDVINDMIVKQIKDSEDERKKIVSDNQVEAVCSHASQNVASTSTSIYGDVNTQYYKCMAHSTVSYNSLNLTPGNNTKGKIHLPMLKNKKKEDLVKVPPWLEDIPGESSTSGNQPSGPVYGPTIETFMKHVENQKKKGLSKNRIGADFKRVKGFTKWLPSFQGVWNQGRRKQMKIQFNRKNKTF